MKRKRRKARAIRASTPSVRPIVGACLEPVEITAAADGGKGPARFAVTAYTGGPLRVDGYELPVVVDLAGMTFARSIRAHLDHDRSKRVGHVTEKTNDGQQVRLAGLASAATPARDEVIGSASGGFDWEASIEATPTSSLEKIDHGAAVELNGRTFEGPLLVARKTTLTGFSFVSLGADPGNQTSIAAGNAAHTSKEHTMSPELRAWIEQLGLDPEKLTADQIARIEANWQGLPGSPPADPPPPADRRGRTVEEVIADAERDRERVNRIATLTAEQLRATPESADQIKAVAELAVRENWTAEKYELELLRNGRPRAHTVFAREGRGRLSERLLEAGLAINGKLKNIEAHFDADTLEAADRRWRHGLGVRQMLAEAAEANGRRVRASGDLRELLHAAFPRELQAAAGFSTISIPNILSATANKFLLQGYNGVEQGWSEVARRKSVSNFLTHTSYRMTTAGFEKVGPTGELKHGTLSEASFTIKADTYGMLLGISREDLVNDDLGALSGVPADIGRLAARKLNTVFWTEWLADNDTFYTTGRANYFSGASTNLQSSSLATGVEKFRKQTDGNGDPLGLEPKLLVVPPEIEVTAQELFVSTNLQSGNTGKQPSVNVFSNKYRPVVSSYLSNSSITGYSTTAWFLVADPMDLPVIEVAFLNGREAPVVETADADFEQLGVRMRGYYDFGVSKQDYRAGVKSKGAA